MNRLAVRRHQVGALAAHGLGDQERAVADGQRGGVELDELHVADGRAGAVRDRDAVAERAGRVGGAGVERARAAGREQRHAGAHRAQLVVAEHPGAGAGLAVGDQADHGGVLDHRIRGRSRTRPISVSAIAAPVALPPAWRIRRRLWPPSRPSSAGRPGRDRTPRPAARGRRSGSAPSPTSTARPPGRRGRGPPAACRPGAARVVVGADRGRDAALGVERVRGAQRALGDEHHRGAPVSRLDRGVEPRKPGAGDQQIDGAVGGRRGTAVG